MTRFTLTVTAAVAALAAGPALADCSAEMDAFQKDYSNLARTGTASGGMTEPVIGYLRDAAVTLRREGNEQACMAVIDAMNVVAENRDAIGSDDSRRTVIPNTSMMPEVGEWPYIDGSPDGTAKAIHDRVVPLAESELTLDTGGLRGISVYNYEGEFLGEVDGLLTRADSAPTHVIVSHGGFWDIGDREVALPKEEIAFDPLSASLFVERTEAEIEEMPKYEMGDQKWRQAGTSGSTSDGGSSTQ